MDFDVFGLIITVFYSCGIRLRCLFGSFFHCKNSKFICLMMYLSIFCSKYLFTQKRKLMQHSVASLSCTGSDHVWLPRRRGDVDNLLLWCELLQLYTLDTLSPRGLNEEMDIRPFLRLCSFSCTCSVLSSYIYVWMSFGTQTFLSFAFWSYYTLYVLISG